jgi:hypothetical protein
MLVNAFPLLRKEESMKKPLALAGLSAFMLIGAAYPDMPQHSYAGDAVVAQDHAVAPVRYRPCRGRNDDRCIQLYERGVRAAYAAWLREREPARVRMASGGPHEPANRHERRGYRRDRDHRDHDSHRGHRRHDRMAHGDTRCPPPEAHHRGELG